MHTGIITFGALALAMSSAIPGAAAAEAGPGSAMRADPGPLQAQPAQPGNAQHQSDAEIRDAVQARFAADEWTDTEQVGIRVQDAIVALDGETDHLLAKERAAMLAQSVRGVRGVINRLRVAAATSATDEGIGEQIRRGLAQDATTSLGDIEVQVDDGVVTLAGEARSWPERVIAGRIATSVPGVNAIDNRIRVAYADPRSDADIKADVVALLRWDPRLAPVPIKVSVNDANVRLTGRVGSLAQRHWASSQAWVNGVDAVDVSGLRIDPSIAKAARADLRASRIPNRNDAEIADALAQALKQDPRVNRDAIAAEIRDGWVRLDGVVPSRAVRESTERLARQIVGVGGVPNRLRVAPVVQIDDERLRTQVKAALNANPITTGSGLVVGVDDGEVSLYGTLSAARQIQEALRVAAAVAGVRSVSNEIDLAPDKAGD